MSDLNDIMKRLQVIGAWAAFIAVVGIVILGFWFIFRYPRF